MGRTLGSIGGYGWTGENPTKLRNILIKANDAFVKLRKTLKFDAIAFSGSSGAVIAFPLAVSHEIPVIYVRKANEQSHGFAVECNGEDQIKKYLIVDDFIASGATIDWIANQVKAYARGPVKLVGVFCFSDSDQRGGGCRIVRGEKVKIYTPSSILR